MKVSFILPAICFLSFAFSGPAIGGRIADHGTALFTSTKAWFPFSDGASGNKWHLDPFSIIKIDDNIWEVNVTSINKLNQYEPNNTVTQRLNCATLEIQTQGWRIGSSFIDNKTAIGLNAANSTRRSIKSGTVNWALKNFICGDIGIGEVFYGLTPYRDTSGQLQIAWIKDHKVYVNNKNQSLVKYGVGVGNDVIIDCAKMQFMNLKVDGSPTWSAPENTELSVAGSVMAKICKQKPSYLIYETSEFSVPEYLSVDRKNEVVVSNVNNQSLDDAKQKCADIGFIRGTEKFGQCVLRISK
jgi:hypothetical protein